IRDGKFKEEIVPLKVPIELPGTNGTQPMFKEISFDVDEGPRSDTSKESLAKLKPVFHARGAVTAGNSSQTSDGAAACLVMSAEARWLSGTRSAVPEPSSQPPFSPRCSGEGAATAW